MRINTLHLVLGTVFGAPLILSVLVEVIVVYKDFTWEPPPWPPSQERIQFPNDHRRGELAVVKFHSLTINEQAAIRLSLSDIIAPVDDWIPELDRQAYDLLCIGENHDDYIRRFASMHVFNSLKMDVLLLEATPAEAADIVHDVLIGEERVEMLGADMVYILKSILSKNPNVDIYGIEETSRQKTDRQNSSRESREATIEKNIRRFYQSGKRHVVLVGAFHCANEPDWLYYRLKQHTGELANAYTRSIRISREHIEGPIEAFVYFLDEISIAPETHFVIKDNAALPSIIRQWFPVLSPKEMGASESLIIFRP